MCANSLLHTIIISIGTEMELKFGFQFQSHRHIRVFWEDILGRRVGNPELPIVSNSNLPLLEFHNIFKHSSSKFVARSVSFSSSAFSATSLNSSQISSSDFDQSRSCSR